MTYANQPELNLMLISAKKKLITTEWPENNYCEKNRKSLMGIEAKNDNQGKKQGIQGGLKLAHVNKSITLKNDGIAVNLYE